MTARRIPFALLVSALFALVAPRATAQCVSLTTMGSASTQNFNTLSNTAGSTTNNLTITGWFMTESGGGARDNEQYAVDTGASNTGDTYSYGAAGNTERALGGLRSGTLISLFGACFTNNTGATILGLDVAYTGEQWRLGTASRTDQLTFQYSTNATDLVTGTWTNEAPLDFVTPKTATAGAKDGNAAANRTARSSSIPVSIANGATFWIRWNDVDASGADDGLAVDDFSLTPQATAGVPLLNISDVTLGEGDAGTTTYTFAVTLSAPAPVGGVSFDIATADGTAQDDNPVTEDSDYVAQSLTGQTIPAGSSGPYNFNVTVNGDTAVEPNETFFVNVTNIVGANAGDAQGLGTINNDDVSITRIHDVQGPGASSPIVGATVTVRGIVTGVKSNGFFVQEEDATIDADPATSEGIFVFTSAAPPAAAAFTSRVQVTGTVVEFVPGGDPQQPPVTELGSPAVVQLAPAGQPLPAAIPLTSTFPDPAGPFDQLERVEGMRVSAASITVSGPSDGSINEPNNTGTSNGRFHGVVTGVARPFREPGVQQPDTVPVGTIPPIPRWDTNPERLRIESATINAQPVLTVKSGDVVAPVAGPLDYGFRGYAIYPDGTLGTPVVTPGTLTTSVTTPTAQEFTVSSFNMFHFYDTLNEPLTSDVVLTPTAFNDRLAKASIAIRNHLKFPDILGVQEVENLATLQALATKISTDAVANSQPDPSYVAYLSEGNDVGGIDVGFLVKTAPVSGGAARVAVNSVTQIGAADTWIDPDDGTPALLNDRPSLVLDAVINRGPGLSFPIIVINNHLRSLIGIDSSAPDGLTTEGDRVRRKRQTQADRLAAYIQGRLTTTPGEHIVLVGDFNAFDFNDGYVDVINTLTGTPPPDDQTVVCSDCPALPDTSDGTDQVNPDLINLVDTPPAAERYSYIHDGNAQNIDHAIISNGLVTDTLARRIEHPRINADYPETERSNNATALRISDHDPVVAFFAALVAADLSVTKTDSPDPVTAGQNLTYSITVTNNGPDPADSVSLSDTLPAGTTFVSLSSPAGWSCTTPAVGAGGTISCSIASLAVTAGEVFTLTVAVDATVANNAVLSNTATVASTSADPATGNESATAATTVQTLAALSVTKSDAPDPVIAGTNVTYTIDVTNEGPSQASSVTLSDTVPAGTTFVSLSAPAGWSCTTPAVGGTGTISCSNAALGLTTASITLVAAVDPSVLDATVLTNTATVVSATTDDSDSDNTATTTTTVITSADVSITKIDTPDPVTAGTNLTYTITVTNAGPSDAAGVVLADTLPAGTTFVSLTSPGGWSCTTPAVGGSGTVNCSLSVFPQGSTIFTLVVATDPSLVDATVISNTATATTTTTDPTPANNSATATTTVGLGSADVLITKIDTPDPVTAGTNLTYTITVTNAGPSNASGVAFADALPAGTTFVSLSSPGGWSCTTPAVGGSGTVNCSLSVFPQGSAIFTLVVATDPSLVDGTVISNTATAAATTTDPTPGNNSATATTVGLGSAELSVTMSDTPDPVTAGTNLSYAIDVTNAGPSSASGVALGGATPAGTTFVSLVAPAGWSCTTPAVGGTGAIDCSISLFPVGNASFTLVVAADPSLADGTVISNSANITATTADPNSANNTATTTTTVGVGSADLFVTMTDTPDPVNAGSDLTWTINVTNGGPTTATTTNWSDTLPTGTTFVSLTPAAGWSCTTPAVGAGGTVSCSIASLVVTTDSFTLVASVDPAVTGGTTLSNTVTLTSATSDPDSTDLTATATTTVLSPGSITATKSVSGSFVPGGSVTYLVVLTNDGAVSPASYAGEDILPPALRLVSASATSGTAIATTSTNTVTFDGIVPAGGSVTITIQATVADSVAAGTVVSNQASVLYDADGNGSNESTELTDDASQVGAADPTTFTVSAAAAVPAIPALDPLSLAALAMLLALAGLMVVRR